MYLSKLEIHGFKSFAQKITLKFSDGLTAIVGPNGSGKTNIVDAIRWVLGEQKSSVLRSDGMEQVIFNGTRTRKPLGMSEVSLTIENNKHILPTEYSQVVISRRLFRDGESTYLLNRTPCRLRDIVDLFTDTGMGADAYSVIELKMIEQILSDKSDERRHLFEEAAGVVKYKQRRKETLRRLSQTQNDLERVHDIIREVQKAVGSLSRQAEKAQSYEKISGNLKVEEITLFRYEYSETLHNLNQIADQVHRIRREHGNLGVEYEQRSREYQELEQTNAAVEKQLQTVLENERKESTVLAIAQQALAVLRERVTALQRDATRTRQEKVSLQEQFHQVANDITATNERKSELMLEQVHSEQTLLERNNERNEESRIVHELRENVRTASEPIHAMESRLHFLASGRERVRSQVNTSHEQSKELAGQIRLTEQQLGDIQQRIDQTNNLLSDARNTVSSAEAHLNSSRTTVENLSARIDETQVELSASRENFSHKQASLEFLQGLTEQTDSANYLIKSGAWKVREKKVLSDCLNVKESLSIAIEAALGDAGSYFVVSDLQEAVAAREVLRSNDKGKASFVCRNAVPEIAAPGDYNYGDGVLGWASELVDCDAVVRNCLRHILGRTLVVNDLDTALKVVPGNIDCAVTLDGEVAFSSGIVRAGSVGKLEGMRVGKRHRIEQLGSELEELRDFVTNLETRLSALRTERGNIDVHAIADELRLRESAKAAHEQSLNELRVRAEALESRIEHFDQRIKAIANENAGFLHEDENINKEVEDLRELKSRSQTDLDAIQNRVSQAEQTLAERDALLRVSELASVRINTELIGCETTLLRLYEHHSGLEQRLLTIDGDISTADASLEQCSTEHAVREHECNALDENFRVARSERVTVEKQAHQSREELVTKNEELKRIRVELENRLSDLHQLEINASHFQTRSEEFIRRAAEEFQIELDKTMSVPVEEITLEQTRVRVQQLKTKLASMGAVNFLALEEHDKEQQRLTQLKAQYDDLIEAEKNLNDTIREINTTAKRLFQEVFDKVRVHFKELFAILFNNDGEADLTIDGDDPLEAQIEIMAKPKGKRPHSIELLSGGEKTLTAIALLFAIYLVKPSPFCILDEVDAPLDDANIDRYLNLIRNFSQNTQFLMITHNKRTMEAADTLYGVTMEEAGVSKMVSVKLREGKQTEAKLEVGSVTEEEFV